MKFQLLIFLTLAMFVIFSATVAMAELIAHWDLDDAAGVTAVDSVGGFNGTLQGDSAWDANGKIGGAIVLDGAGDYVQTTLLDEVRAAESFTIAAWFKTNVTDSGQQHILWMGQSGGNGWGDQDELHMGINHFDYNNKVVGFFGNGSDIDPNNINYASVEDFTDTSDWHHLAFAVKNADGPVITAELFLDGELQEAWFDGFLNDGRQIPTTDTVELPIERVLWDTALRIGAPSLDQRYFNGMIDEVMVWDEALEANGVQDAMKGGSGATVRPGEKLTTTWGALK